MEVTDGYDRFGDDETPDVTDARQNVRINVTDVNEAPEVEGDAAPSVRENSDRAVATYTGKDPERDKLTWSVSDDNFWISDEGQLYFATPPSFEDGASYNVTVTATDDAATPLPGSLNVTVTVMDVEEEGTITIEPPRGWVDTQTLFTTVPTDDDGGVTVETWQWARSPNGRSSWTDITSAMSDRYTVTAADADQYLRVRFEYEDRRGAGKSAEAVLTAPIGDVRPAANTAPEFTDTGPVTRTVREGTAAGRSIGARVRATDPDPGDILIYSLSGQDAGLFDIGPATGQLLTKAVLDYDPDPQAENRYTVTVEVHDGFDAAYNESSASDATIEVTITVTAAPVVRPRPPRPPPRPPSNLPPVFADGPRTDRSIAENTSAGENVGPPVVATDSGILTYMLGGADAGSFGIVTATGQIQVGDGTILDHEAEKSTYIVEVTATDPSGATAVITVTIAVTNLDEPGTVTLSSEEPTVDAELTATIGDLDGGVTDVTWQWARTMDMVAGWDDITGATNAAYTPVVTDEGYYLQATASYTDGHGSGKSAMIMSDNTVVDAVDPLVARYDANGNGTIEKSEVIKAINDYLFGEGDEAISKSDVIRLINLYLFGSSYAATTGDSLVARYDANGNGTIEKSEVIRAINDYLFNEGDEAISKAEVIELINLYLFGPS